jgi:HTH-type transcriptional regulator / antitoxin HigA
MSKAVHPGKHLRELLDERGWTQDELARVTGKRRQTISGIVAGKTGVTPEMAVSLGAAFGNNPTEWLRWSAEYELSIAETDSADVERRARLYTLAPVREMIKRGWINIQDMNNDDALERQLTQFFGGSLDSIFPVAARRTIDLASLNPSEKAWCFRARQLSMSILAETFDQSRLDQAERQLRKAAAFQKDATKVAKILSEFGIRFVIIEPLPGAKIDGASFWLDDNSPVIALSIRFDRLDAFWFTLFHEFAHIKHGDALSVDIDVLSDLEGGIGISLAKEEQEVLANEAAARALIPRAEIDSFVSRIAPYYSRERIIQFAHRIRIHPAIIIGQLQHRNEIGYSALREFLVKIRSIVTETALTDGWGHFAPRISVEEL